MSELGNIAARMRDRPPASVLRAVERARKSAGGEPIQLTPEDLGPRREPTRRERRAAARSARRLRP
jgi:hypothetical protein